ncbi:MAG TPA: Gfo/Idh/MocA family oxidoreductase [bacterium]|uniref:4-carboxy-2-hydroxymuconate-6-semialdehyde dehydrogenase n=1 Tax=candidate division TA06 bacterium ADurb.Bin417 TaxID=1852828 RepID=A0A1V5M7K3_UNCT6|nr:MAG: 4-carboxy-2-hydroxymuconate-6-semialdehyde dehydrogenase [candidate division TA06 bacterium ADurb.Bin417]HNQ36004.1 Gfo/Idh/MocA family oxidoreductase [bacterium]HNS48077.1 Gfo/Idh/MocA family oxidoreductase [bacterium]
MEKTRMILAGVGKHGRSWLKVLKEHPAVSLAGVVDVNPANLTAARAAAGLDESDCFVSLAACLKARPAGVLVNVTPPDQHRAVSLAGLKAGLHILVEKPLADRLESAAAIVKAARRYDRKLMVAQNYRFTPWARTVQRLTARERCLGAIGSGQVTFQRGPHFGGFREEMDYPLLVDMAIHHFDLMRGFLAEEAVEVYARSFRPGWSWFRHDPAVALVFSLAGGGVVSYFGSWVARGFNTEWNGDWRLEGEKGLLLSCNNRLWLTPAEAPAEVREVPVPGAESGRANSQAEVIDELLAAIREGREPETSGADNLKSLALVFAALESVRRGRPVRVASLFRKIGFDFEES